MAFRSITNGSTCSVFDTRAHAHTRKTTDSSYGESYAAKMLRKESSSNTQLSGMYYDNQDFI